MAVRGDVQSAHGSALHVGRPYGDCGAASYRGRNGSSRSSGLQNAAPNARTGGVVLSVGITEIAERLGLAVLRQAATKSDVGAVDPNGDIVTGVAGAGGKIQAGQSWARLLVRPSHWRQKVRLCCAATIPLRGKLVRQRIGAPVAIPARSASIPPILSDARESPPPARPAG